MNRLSVAFVVLFVLVPLTVPVTGADKDFADGSPGRMTWGTGEHYKLPTDQDGWSIVEPGQVHRTIYAAADGTRDNSGLSPASPVDLKTGQRHDPQGKF